MSLQCSARLRSDTSGSVATTAAGQYPTPASAEYTSAVAMLDDMHVHLHTCSCTCTQLPSRVYM